MAEKVLMTALSPTMEVGTIVNWLKKEKEQIASGDVLCEVETDKASMEYETIQEGTLLKIITQNGGQAKVGEPIAIIGDKGEAIDALLKEIEEQSAAEEKAAAEKKSAVAAPAKTTAAAPAKTAAAAAPKTGSPRAAAQKPAADGWVNSSPLARKIANYHNVPIEQVSGSGPAGRVVKRDVEEAMSKSVPGSARFIAHGGAQRADATVPVSAIRKIIAQRTSESKFSAPHYYLSVAVHMQPTITARNALNASLKKQGKKVSFNAFLLKFAAEALKRYPEVNAAWQGENILQFGSIDIGLTVDVGNGLITPIVRDCGSKGILEIDDQLSQMIDKVRSNSLQSSEYQGATHTVSNLGSFGIDSFTAVINPPGAAIWAIGKTTPTPVVDDNGQIVVRPMMNTTLSCDHRVIDGKLAAEYLSTLKQFMENPASILY